MPEHTQLLKIPSARPSAPRSSPSRLTRALAVLGIVCAIVFLAAILIQQLISQGAQPALPQWSQQPSDYSAELSIADGVVETGQFVSVFDDVPAVSNLNPDLLAAVRLAAEDAVQHGIEFQVNSGWRSEGLQARLLEDAIGTYGSAEEAARWVATPERSLHVKGDAIDIGDYDASSWLSQYGSAYGLCQTYGNEPWHYELRPAAVSDGCPEPYADPTQDPR